MSLPERVERMCIELGRGQLRDVALEAGALPLLERIVAAILHGADDGLAADLDAFDEALARIDIDGITGGVRTFEALPGLSGHRPEYVWVCPSRSCTRGITAIAAEPAPGCSVFGVPLERSRLGG